MDYLDYATNQPMRDGEEMSAFFDEMKHECVVCKQKAKRMEMRFHPAIPFRLVCMDCLRKLNEV